MVLLVALEKKSIEESEKERSKQTNKNKKQRNKEKKKRGKERKKNSPFACNAFWVTGIIIESVHSSTWEKKSCQNPFMNWACLEAGLVA